MKAHTLFQIIATVFFLGPASAFVTADDAIKAVDPSGTWRWDYERDNGEVVKNQLKIDTKEKNEVVATYYGLMDGLQSKNGTIDGDKLTLDFDVEGDGYSFQVKYVATIKGNKVTGTISASNDEGSRDWAWEATRSVELADVVGQWNLKLETPNGEIREPVLTVSKKDDTFSAVYKSPQYGEFPVKDLKAKDDAFTFALAGQVDGTDFVAKCKMHPKGSKLSGEMTLELPDQTIDLVLSGKLAAKK